MIIKIKDSLEFFCVILNLVNPRFFFKFKYGISLSGNIEGPKKLLPGQNRLNSLSHLYFLRSPCFAILNRFVS
jgi:hypothetical protein